MKNTYTGLGIVVLIGSLLIPHISVIAQSLDTPPPTAEEIEKLIQSQKDNPSTPVEYKSNLNPEGLKSARLGNCFDVYKFGNVDISLGLDKNEYEPAELIMFQGSIKNKNTYPLPGLKVRAKVVKIDQEGGRRIVKTVDEFIVQENISLDSLQSKDIQGTYQLPLQAAKGEYELLLSITQYDQISIAGVSFTDDVYAFNPKFSIKGDKQEKISIKQSQITLNDEVYNNLSFNPIYPKIEPITIKVPIQNNTNNIQKVTVSYELYSWSDDLGEAAKVKEVLKQELELVGQASTNAIYTVEDIKEAVYYIKITVKTIDDYQNSNWDNIANIRFSQQNINEARFASVGFNTAPYNPSGSLDLVTCIHNTNDRPVDVEVENTIKDDKGKIIAKSTYTGPVRGDIDGIYTELPKNKKYNVLTVNSTIKDTEGNIVNSIDLTYDCKELDPSKCKGISNNASLWAFLGGVVLLGGLTLGIREYRRRTLKSVK
jgi:hypothetical protein